MFERGIGVGLRSDRFGTWALGTFIVLALQYVGFTVLAPLGTLTGLVCTVTTLGAVGCGIVGLVSGDPEQRHGAAQGLLKAALPALAGAAFLFLLLAFLTSDQPLFG
jgi:hypothetical protein